MWPRFATRKEEFRWELVEREQIRVFWRIGWFNKKLRTKFGSLSVLEGWRALKSGGCDAKYRKRSPSHSICSTKRHFHWYYCTSKKLSRCWPWWCTPNCKNIRSCEPRSSECALNCRNIPLSIKVIVINSFLGGMHEIQPHRRRTLANKSTGIQPLIRPSSRRNHFLNGNLESI